MITNTFRKAIVGTVFFCAHIPGTLVAGECSYKTYTWNTHTRSAVDYRRVEKPYAELEPYEVDAATGCTVCEQDQIEINLSELPPFKICRVFAEPLRRVLRGLIDSGAPIEQVTGYRVGMTRGNADADGNRTQFSNHSFGIALDINSEQNGLYDHCIQYGFSCRLIMGGLWRPGEDGRSLTANGETVNALKALGFKWGGEIAGRQKDFMHFSPTGY